MIALIINKMTTQTQVTGTVENKTTCKVWYGTPVEGKISGVRIAEVAGFGQNTQKQKKIVVDIEVKGKGFIYNKQTRQRQIAGQNEFGTIAVWSPPMNENGYFNARIDTLFANLISSASNRRVQDNETIDLNSLVGKEVIGYLGISKGQEVFVFFEPLVRNSTVKKQDYQVFNYTTPVKVEEVMNSLKARGVIPTKKAKK